MQGHTEKCPTFSVLPCCSTLVSIEPRRKVERIGLGHSRKDYSYFRNDCCFASKLEEATADIIRPANTAATRGTFRGGDHYEALSKRCIWVEGASQKHYLLLNVGLSATSNKIGDEYRSPGTLHSHFYLIYFAGIPNICHPTMPVLLIAHHWLKWSFGATWTEAAWCTCLRHKKVFSCFHFEG